MRISRQHRFTALLAALILQLFVLPPLLGGQPLLLFLLRASFFFVILSACYSVAPNRRAFRLSLVLAAVAIAGNLLQDVAKSHLLFVASEALAIVFFLWIVLLLLRDVLGGATGRVDRIAGAICVYLLLGFLWGQGYWLLEQLQPGSFALPARQIAVPGQPTPLELFVYFSFVTLTTLGYGDVSPLSAAARAMAAFEAVVGPLYLAVLVARLVAALDRRPGT